MRRQRWWGPGVLGGGQRAEDCTAARPRSALRGRGCTTTPARAYPHMPPVPQGYGEEDYLIFDCPGQIELYNHLSVFKTFVEYLK